MAERVDQAHRPRGGEPHDLSELVDRPSVKEFTQGHQRRRGRRPMAGRRLFDTTNAVIDPQGQDGQEVGPAPLV